MEVSAQKTSKQIHHALSAALEFVSLLLALEVCQFERNSLNRWSVVVLKFASRDPHLFRQRVHLQRIETLLSYIFLSFFRDAECALRQFFKLALSVSIYFQTLECLSLNQSSGVFLRICPLSPCTEN